MYLCLCVTVSGINCPSSSYLFYLSPLSIQSTDDHPIPSPSSPHPTMRFCTTYLPDRPSTSNHPHSSTLPRPALKSLSKNVQKYSTVFETTKRIDVIMYKKSLQFLHCHQSSPYHLPFPPATYQIPVVDPFLYYFSAFHVLLLSSSVLI